MSLSDSFLPLLLVMAAVSFLCRAIGFFLMRFVPMTPRVDAALKATPLAVMAGITALTAVNGRIAEWIALGVVVIAMKLTGNDLGAAIIGMVVVAAFRFLDS